MRWYAKAAEKGRPEAEYRVGYMYEQGLGVPKSTTEAMKWYKMAADKGDASAHQALIALQK
jgi:uncharacterized protein